MKYLVEAGAIGVRRCKKEDLRRIAAATGGTLLPNLADLDGGETFDPAHLGRAEEVSEERVGDGACCAPRVVRLSGVGGTTTPHTVLLSCSSSFSYPDPRHF
jgi:hypothetical protein